MNGQQIINSLQEGIKNDCLSRDMTASINGLFIALVFLSHLRSYISQDAYCPLDEGFLWLIAQMGQLVVVTFLFFSGYGIMESIKNKPGYIEMFPHHRILPFLLDMWLAVAVYLVFMLMRGETPPLSQVLLSMVGWLNLGNSNWYVFATLWMYVSTYIAFRLAWHSPSSIRFVTGALLTTVGAILYAQLMKHERVGGWYYSTILCFPAGMFLSLAVRPIRCVFMRPRWGKVCAIATICVLLPLFLSLHRIRFERALMFNFLSIVFALIIVSASVLLPRVSRPFSWVGKHLFEFFIYQRLPMMALAPIASKSTLLYTFCCFIACMAFCPAMVVVHRRYQALVFNER